MAKRVGLISINLEAGTAQFNTDLAAAQAKMRAFASAAKSSVTELSSHTVSGMQAASGSIRLFEGNLTNNLRAVENFISKTLGLGPALQAIFPVVGAAAFAGLLAEMGGKVVDFFKTISDHSEKAKGEFAELNNAVRLTNDSMQVANDKLANEIAKLEHKPENVLKLALDEATLAADKLSAALDKDLSSLNKLVAEQKQGFWADLASRESGTKDIAEELGGATGFGGFRARIAGLSGADAKKAFDDEIKKLQGWLANAQQAQWSRQFGLSGIGMQEGQQNRIETLQAVIRNLTEGRQGIDLTGTNTTLTARKQSLEAGKALTEEEQRELKAGYDKMLAAEEAFGEMLASEKLAFRQNELTEISQYGTKYKQLRQELMIEIGNLEQSAFREAKAARDADAKDQERYLEEMGRIAVEWSKRNYEAVARANKTLLGGTGLEPRPDLPQAAITGNALSRLAGTPLGTRMMLQEAGHASIAVQQAEIANEQRILTEMEKGGYTLGQQIEQRKKILDLQNALTESVKGADAADAYREAQIKELLHLGSLRDGWNAFWLEQQQQAEKTGKILFDALSSTVGGVSKNLANLSTGGRTDWGKTFEDIGRQMVERQISATLHNALGALGRRLGIGGVTRRDGQTAASAVFVEVVGPAGQTTKTAPASSGGGLGGYLGMAMGDIFSGQSKKNPMIFNMNGMPSAAGGPSALGDTYYISVDARGADENVIYQRVAAGVMAAHNAAVGNSVQATYERQQRIPQ